MVDLSCNSVLWKVYMGVCVGSWYGGRLVPPFPQPPAKMNYFMQKTEFIQAVFFSCFS